MRTVGDMTFFFTEKDVFSNWHRSVFEIKGVRFVCMEQFMMFCKAKLFGDEEIAAKILLADHPREHKALGRKVSGFIDSVWDEKRENIVAHGCYAKFKQNPHMLKDLLETKTSILVEASPYDKIWGVGLSENDPRIQDRSTWKGLNLLGFALMHVREKLVAELKLESGAIRSNEQTPSPLDSKFY